MKQLCYLFLFLFCFESSFAQEHITREKVKDFLVKEMKYINAQRIDDYMSLFLRTAKHIDKNKKTHDWSDIRLISYKGFIASKYILHKVKLDSLVISRDGISASLVTTNTTKYLLSRGGRESVITELGRTEALVILDNGKLKYKLTKYLDN